MDAMQEEHQQAETDGGTPDWWWISEKTHPGHGLDFEEYRQHHDVWIQTRAEWKELEVAGKLNDESRLALMERLAASLPGDYTGAFEAVSGVTVGLVERLLQEDLDFNPIIEWDQALCALEWAQHKLRPLGMHASIEVDAESEMVADDGVKSYTDFDIGLLMDDDDDRDLLTIKDVCAELGIATRTMHNHIQRKRGTPAAVPAFKVGRQLVLYRRDFEEWRRKHYQEKFAPKRRQGRPGAHQDQSD